MNERPAGSMTASQFADTIFAGEPWTFNAMRDWIDERDTGIAEAAVVDASESLEQALEMAAAIGEDLLVMQAMLWKRAEATHNSSHFVMGEFNRGRLDDAIDNTIELIEGMGSWPWPGSLRAEIEGLVTEAYAFGREARP